MDTGLGARARLEPHERPTAARAVRSLGVASFTPNDLGWSGMAETARTSPPRSGSLASSRAMERAQHKAHARAVAGPVNVRGQQHAHEIAAEPRETAQQTRREMGP